VNRYVALLKNLFNKAIDWSKAEHNPVTGIKQFKETWRVRYLTEEEEEVLRSVFPPKYWPWVEAAFPQGQPVITSLLPPSLVLHQVLLHGLLEQLSCCTIRFQRQDPDFAPEIHVQLHTNLLPRGLLFPFQLLGHLRAPLRLFLAPEAPDLGLDILFRDMSIDHRRLHGRVS
jgi:hypothetical protein